jgi:hypothetical protein
MPATRRGRLLGAEDPMPLPAILVDDPSGTPSISPVAAPPCVWCSSSSRRANGRRH